MNAEQPKPKPAPAPQRVVIEGVDIDLGDLVVLLFKLLVASIPVAIAVGVVVGFVWLIVTSIMNGPGLPVQR